MMNLMVIDDFYDDPMAMRLYALEQDFDVRLPLTAGARTRPLFAEQARRRIEMYMSAFAGRITSDITKNFGMFQSSVSSDRSWVHADAHHGWAAVCYMTPDAPVTGGTAFYRSRITGQWLDDPDRPIPNSDHVYDNTRWELLDLVANRFNRMVIFRSDLYHSSVDYFGTDLATSRLIQNFFFSTEFYNSRVR